MSVEVSVKFKCDACGKKRGKKINANGEVRTGRRQDFIEVPGAFIVNTWARETGMNSMRLEHLVVYGDVSDHALKQSEQDDNSKIACSPACVVKLVTKCMEKMR